MDGDEEYRWIVLEDLLREREREGRRCEAVLAWLGLAVAWLWLWL